MASNKTTCIHITSEKILLLEGRINSGVMLVTRTAVVSKAGRFFHNDRLADMSRMVSAIINTMTVNSFTSNQLYIIYDNNLEVDFFLDEKLTQSQKEGSKGINIDLGSLFKKKDGDGDGGSKSSKSSGIISHRKPWGIYVTESEQGQLYTTVKIERDLVEFMISEFQEQGYKVVSIEPPETAMLYLRKFVPFTYDALNKLVVHANEKDRGMFYYFTKDMPSNTKQFNFDMTYAETFTDSCVATIQDEIRKSHLRNPVVMLVGAAFQDEDEYIDICNALRDEGIGIIDIYGLWKDRSQPINMLRVVTPNQGVEIELNGPFGVCVAAMLRSTESKPENLIEGFHPMFIGKKTKNLLCSVAKTAAGVFAVYAILTLAISSYEVYVANDEFQRASNTTAYQLSIAEHERDAAKEKLNVLGTIDSRYNEIFKFVYAQVSDNLNIASVDTMDLIPVAESTPSVYAEENTETPAEVNVTAATTSPDGYVFQTIVIRGYSRTSEGPIALYRALTSAGMGETKIVGIEQVGLPSGETIFAFEMTVGVN